MLPVPYFYWSIHADAWLQISYYVTRDVSWNELDRNSIRKYNLLIYNKAWKSIFKTELVSFTTLQEGN